MRDYYMHKTYLIFYITHNFWHEKEHHATLIANTIDKVHSISAHRTTHTSTHDNGSGYSGTPSLHQPYMTPTCSVAILRDPDQMLPDIYYTIHIYTYYTCINSFTEKYVSYSKTVASSSNVPSYLDVFKVLNLGTSSQYMNNLSIKFWRNKTLQLIRRHLLY